MSQNCKMQFDPFASFQQCKTCSSDIMSRKREWSDGLRPSAYESDASTSTSTEPTDSSSEGGEAITSDLKRLRVAYNYDGEHRDFSRKAIIARLIHIAF
jgi:hypothetical protein